MGRINVTGNGNHLTEINGKTESSNHFVRGEVLLGYSEDEEVIIAGLVSFEQDTVLLRRLDGELIGSFKINKVRQNQGSYSGLSRLSRAYLKDGNVYLFRHRAIEEYTKNGQLVATYKHSYVQNDLFVHRGFFYFSARYGGSYYVYKMNLNGQVVRQMKIDMTHTSNSTSFYVNDEHEKVVLNHSRDYVLCDLRKNEIMKFNKSYGRDFTNLMLYGTEGLVAGLGGANGCNLYRIVDTVLVGEKYVTFAFFSTGDDWPRVGALGLFICYDINDKQKITYQFHRVVDLYNWDVTFLVLPSKKVLFISTGNFQSF